MEIIGWLTGGSDVGLPDPLERAEEYVKTLSKQRRYEEAQSLKEACEHLLSIRRSYAALAEARGLRFATLWPQTGNGSGPSVRLNLVWNGRLREPVSLYPSTIEAKIREALEPLWSLDPSPSVSATASPVAVPQKELDLFLAIRRWFCETEHAPKLPIPGPDADQACREAFETKLVAEAHSLFVAKAPSPEAARSGS
jgi:hypothetical protein